MSKGPGWVERAIEAVFMASPSQAFSVSELVPLVYGANTVPAKKHRVAILRAAEKVSARLGNWLIWRREAQGSEVIYLNSCDVRSYAIGRLRTGYPARSASEAARVLDDANHPQHKRYSELITRHSPWWDHVALARALRSSDGLEADRLRRLIAKREEQLRIRAAALAASR